MKHLLPHMHVVAPSAHLFARQVRHVHCACAPSSCSCTRTRMPCTSPVHPLSSPSHTLTPLRIPPHLYTPSPLAPPHAPLCHADSSPCVKHTAFLCQAHSLPFAFLCVTHAALLYTPNLPAQLSCTSQPPILPFSCTCHPPRTALGLCECRRTSLLLRLGTQ